MNYIKRNLENVVSQVTKEYPVVLVTGPRQVGKTTMLQKLMEGTERGYVTLDDLNERNIAKTDPELFLQLHKPPVLIDEVQYISKRFMVWNHLYCFLYGCKADYRWFSCKKFFGMSDRISINIINGIRNNCSVNRKV